MAPLLNDPVIAFLQREQDTAFTDVSEENNEENESITLTHPPALLWRQDRKESFSDWKIVLIADDSERVEDGHQNSPDHSSKRPRRGGNDVVVDEEESEIEANPNITYQTTFYVHRNILSSVSVFFKSQFTQVDSIEQRTSTSTFSLSTKAIQAFTIFMDYLYSPEHGRLGFCRENAVALRHLAMYFGVDTLFTEITDIILADMKTKPAGKVFYEMSSVFNDTKLKEAIRMQRIRQEIVLEMAPSTYKTIVRNPSRYLQNDNEVLSAWKHVMSQTDLYQDKFFALKNVNTFPDISISGAGLKQANGVYKLVGKINGVGEYSNGVCMLYKNFDDKWCISIGYINKAGDWKDKELYKTSGYRMDRDWDLKYTEDSNNVELLSAPQYVIPLKSP